MSRLRRDTDKARAFAAKRGGSLKRGKGPSRGKPIRKQNPERAAKRWALAFGSEERCAWIRSLGCSVPACAGTQIEVAHARSRGAGGRADETLPLCHRHHRLSHDMGVQSFERHVGFRLADVAGAVELRWRAYSGRVG